MRGFRRTHRKLPSGAFTFIELLVVVATIAVLAALLLPMLPRAKASSRSAACKSNLRQIGIGLNLYLADHAAYPPGFEIYKVPYRNYVFEEVGWGWYQRIFKYAGDERLLLCPGGASIYCYNYSGGGRAPDGGTLGLGGSLEQSRRESELKAPGEMLALGDSRCNSIVGFGWPGVPAGWADYYRAPHPTRRSNAVFCDGHTESSNSDLIAKNADGYFQPDELHAKRWNYDNEPHPETFH